MSEISRIESSISSLEEQAKITNQTYKNSTDLIWKWVDNLVGIFWGETVEKIYTNQILSIQKQAKSLLTQLHIETLTEEQKIRLERLKDWKLEDVRIVQMTKNTDLKQAVVNSLYGVKWEITGTVHGLKVMITGVIDLAVFMGKYAGSMLGIHPEYKTKINEHATLLFDWMKKEWRIWIQDKVFEFIEQEMIRISTLPQEEQAEAIGNIAGNIIGMLTGMKVWLTLASKKGEMAGKVAQVARITEKLAKRATVNTGRITQVGNLGKQAWYIRMGATVGEKTLNGVAESLIWYGFAKWLSVTWELIRNSTVSVSKKLSSIEKTILEMEEALKTETNPTQQQSIQEEMRKLREERIKIQRPEQNLDEIKANAMLSPEARIQKTKEILEVWENKLTQEQINVIWYVHEKISKGIFSNDYTTLRIMNNELKRAGFNEESIRKLMESWILWKIWQWDELIFAHLKPVTIADRNNAMRLLGRPIEDVISGRLWVIGDKVLHPEKYITHWKQDMNHEQLMRIVQKIQNGQATDTNLRNLLITRNNQDYNTISTIQARLNKADRQLFNEQEEKFRGSLWSTFIQSSWIQWRQIDKVMPGGGTIKHWVHPNFEEWGGWTHCIYGKKPEIKTWPTFKYYHTIPVEAYNDTWLHQKLLDLTEHIRKVAGDRYLEIKFDAIIKNSKQTDNIVLHSDDPLLVFQVWELMKDWGKKSGVYQSRPAHRPEYGVDPYFTSSWELTPIPINPNNHTSHSNGIAIKALKSGNNPNDVLNMLMKINFTLEWWFYDALRARTTMWDNLWRKILDTQRRTGVDQAVVIANSKITDFNLRIMSAIDVLGGKRFTSEQVEAIKKCHETISKWVYQNWYSELREMDKILKKAGFTKEEIRKLMENGILGFWLRSVSRTDGISDYAIGKLHRIELPEEWLERGWLYGHGSINSNADKQIEQYRKQVQQNQRKILRDHERIEKKEVILENAKQVGAKLFVLGEDIMRQNPKLTWIELKELILQKATKNGMKVSSYQLRVLDKQAEIYDALKMKRDEKLKWWFDKAGITMPKNLKQAEVLINANEELNFVVWRDTVTHEMSQINIITSMMYSSGKDIKVTADLLGNKNDSWNNLLKELHRSQNGVSVELNKSPLAITVYADDAHIRLYWDEHWIGTQWYFSRWVNDMILNVWKNAPHDVSDHEYQHFLNKHFLNPDIFNDVWPNIRWNSPIQEINKKVWREVYAHMENGENLRGNVWHSMQNELCSYIERNGQLPKDIDSYLDSSLKNKLKNWEIPKENIWEMERAIQELGNYFNNPNFPREELVWIIRTSFSMENMLNRLSNKYVQ